MRHLESFGVWCLKFMGGFAVLGFAIYYALLHRALQVPLQEITGLAAVHTGLTAACCPFLYISLKRGMSPLADWRPLFITVGMYGLLGVPLFFYYLSRFGFIPLSSVRGLCITAVVAIPPGTVAAYYVSRRISPHLYIRRDSG